MRNTIYHLINYHQNKKYRGKTHRITDKDKFIVLASDGLWVAMANYNVFNVINKR